MIFPSVKKKMKETKKKKCLFPTKLSSEIHQTLHSKIPQVVLVLNFWTEVIYGKDSIKK